MKIIVQKYGGSSLATPDLISKIASNVISTKRRGYEVVVVVSALGDTTDHLVELSQKVAQNPPRREMDMLLSVGERISISLLAMAISEKGYAAISFTGSQVGIITNTDHTRARILEIKGDRIRQELRNGKIVVVAGYQGVSVAKEITTLGRGGSDTTAVALTAALNAERCEILTDVDGIYTGNPRTVIDAKLISEMTHDEMLDMAEFGSHVLNSAAVEFAKRHNIKIYVGSSFTGKIGTIVTDDPLDRGHVTGVTVDENVVLLELNDRIKETNFSLISDLVREGIAVKFILESRDMCSIVLKKEDLAAAKNLIGDLSQVAIHEETGLISVIGVGINFETHIMGTILNVFAEMSLIPRLYCLSETRLSFGIMKDSLEEAASKIHRALLIDTPVVPDLHNEKI